MVSKIVGISIVRGQKLRLETPGGGGYGNPRDRDPESVTRDVCLGFVTPDCAKAEYGVALSETGDVDTSATQELRAQEAAE